MSDEVETAPGAVARAALCEVGRSDLAENVGSNRVGNPTLRPEHRGPGDQHVIVKAFLLDHLSRGHHARLDDEGIRCDECYGSVAPVVDQ
jgi:hypothetical protein